MVNLFEMLMVMKADLELDDELTITFIVYRTSFKLLVYGFIFYCVLHTIYPTFFTDVVKYIHEITK